MTEANDPDRGLTYGRGELPPESFDIGVRGSTVGSFMPDTSYRAVPMVWFAGAWFIHSMCLAFLLLLLQHKAPWFTWATTMLVTIMVARRTFARGMREAGPGWRIATVTMLALNWLWVAALAAAR